MFYSNRCIQHVFYKNGKLSVQISYLLLSSVYIENKSSALHVVNYVKYLYSLIIPYLI